ncbi:hypothetical protein AVEN_244045-1 [Araneus ventricosus]|uniref:Uncharacterized protein n=1 Tax=Araneus ventricosus TaxID=182803 RepID=A0A4Y2LRB5_ARAVE|nr:hypothetical protein AVEN_244045-1 [Araneus ventricosus]
MKIQILAMMTMDLRIFYKIMFLIMKFELNDTESEEDGDSGNEEVNNYQLFSSKDGVEWTKTKCRQNIRTRHNIMSRLPGTKGPAKDVTNPVKS